MLNMDHYAYLADIFGFGYLLTDDGLFVTSVGARLPTKHCVWPPRHVALASIFNLRGNEEYDAIAVHGL